MPAQLVKVEPGSAVAVRSTDDPQSTRDRLGLAALTLAESFCDQGRETLLFLEENLISIATVERFAARRRSSDRAALTILLWQHYPSIMPAGEQVYTRLLHERDGQIVFNRALGKTSSVRGRARQKGSSELVCGDQVRVELSGYV